MVQACDHFDKKEPVDLADFSPLVTFVVFKVAAIGTRQLLIKGFSSTAIRQVRLFRSFLDHAAQRWVNASKLRICISSAAMQIFADLDARTVFEMVGCGYYASPAGRDEKLLSTTLPFAFRIEQGPG